MTITISRLTGSGGSEIARLLANELRMDLIGGEIINKVAQSAKMSKKLSAPLTKKTSPGWTASLTRCLHPATSRRNPSWYT